MYISIVLSKQSKIIIFSQHDQGVCEKYFSLSLVLLQRASLASNLPLSLGWEGGAENYFLIAAMLSARRMLS